MGGREGTAAKELLASIVILSAAKDLGTEGTLIANRDPSLRSG